MCVYIRAAGVVWWRAPLNQVAAGWAAALAAVWQQSQLLQSQSMMEQQLARGDVKCIVSKPSSRYKVPLRLDQLQCQQCQLQLVVRQLCWRVWFQVFGQVHAPRAAGAAGSCMLCHAAP